MYIRNDEEVAEPSPVHLQSWPELTLVMQVNVVALQWHCGGRFRLVTCKYGIYCIYHHSYWDLRSYSNFWFKKLTGYDTQGRLTRRGIIPQGD